MQPPEPQQEKAEVEYIDFSAFVGKTFIAIRELGEAGRPEEIVFETEDCDFHIRHEQDCCETVTLEDVCGDFADLIGSPIVLAEESISNKPEAFEDGGDRESFTWSFYRIGTVKGTVILRWYGESNGYYSETVSIVRYEKPTSSAVERDDPVRLVGADRSIWVFSGY